MSEWRIQRFWESVDASGGEEACWPWMKGIYRATGYGQATTIRDLPGSPSSPSTTAHRQAWIIANGDPGEYVNEQTGKAHKRKVLHRCPDGPNRLCCNPKHLAIGSDQDNADDRERDGNQARGERMGSAKLTEDQVVEIRRRHGEGEMVTVLAEEFDVSHGTVGALVRRETWKHV